MFRSFYKLAFIITLGIAGLYLAAELHTAIAASTGGIMFDEKTKPVAP